MVGQTKFGEKHKIMIKYDFELWIKIEWNASNVWLRNDRNVFLSECWTGHGWAWQAMLVELSHNSFVSKRSIKFQNVINIHDNNLYKRENQLFWN